MSATGARRLRRIHGIAVLAWLTVGAALSWLLKDSVAWVTVMSWYAIVAAHTGGWQGARAEQASS